MWGIQEPLGRFLSSIIIMEEMTLHWEPSRENLEDITQVGLSSFNSINNLKQSNNLGAYIDDLVDNFDSPVKHYDQVKEAVVVLREALAAAEVNDPS